MQRRVMDLWVGLFVATAFAAMLFLALRVSNMGNATSADNSYVIKAEFDNIGGLKVRAPVKSGGVVIGRVEGVTLEPRYYDKEKTRFAGYVALVQMRVGNSFKFPKDSTAEILTSGMLGEQYVGLEVGGESDMLVGNDIIAKDHTNSAIVLERALTQYVLNKADETGSDKPASKPAEDDPLK